MIYPLVCDAQIENLYKKYAAVATDIKTGKQVIMDGGSVLDAVSASSAYHIISVSYTHMTLPTILLV